MSSPNIKAAAAAKAGDLFVPRPLELVTICKATVKLYPVITLSMKPPEWAHAFQVNKTPLAVPGIDRHVMLDTLRTQISLNATVNGTVGNWYCHFDCNWCNFAHLSILLFHNNAGAQVLIWSPQQTLQFCFQFRMVLWPIAAGPISSSFTSNSIWTLPLLSPSGHLETPPLEPSTTSSFPKILMT
jgi:hypothetical protein